MQLINVSFNPSVVHTRTIKRLYVCCSLSLLIFCITRECVPEIKATVAGVMEGMEQRLFYLSGRKNFRSDEFVLSELSRSVETPGRKCELAI